MTWNWIWYLILLFGLGAIALGVLQIKLEQDPRHIADMQRRKIHKAQQAAMKRFHQMQARDRKEPAYAAWWKALGIKPKNVA